jgi:N-methylhydantoinase B
MHRTLRDGTVVPLGSTESIVLEEGELLYGTDTGGGGYGDPLEREADRVLRDVVERWVSREQAREAYGVVIVGDADDETLAVDADATTRLRDALRAVA